MHVIVHSNLEMNTNILGLSKSHPQLACELFTNALQFSQNCHYRVCYGQPFFLVCSSERYKDAIYVFFEGGLQIGL